MGIQLTSKKYLARDAALINNYINDRISGTSQSLKSSDIDIMTSDLNMKPNQLYYTLKELGVAIALFTGGNVLTVRSPKMFDPDKAAGIYSDNWSNPSFLDFLSIKNPADMNMIPTQRDYTKSRQLLIKLANISSHVSTTGVSIATLYRGLGEIDFNTLNSWVRPGTVFDLGALASTSIEQNAAKTFSGKDEGSIILVINNKKSKGLYVEGLSSFQEEREVILSGDVVTVGCSGMTAEWSDSASVLKETTMWDVILKSKKAAKLDIEYAMPSSNTFKNAVAILAAHTIIYVDLI